MICPSCASDTPAPGGRCTVCSAEVSADVAAAVATPVPTDPPAAGNDASGAGTFAAQLGYVGQASEEDLTQSADASESPLSTGSGPLVPGQAFGPRYQVIKLLGAGGMGEVYHAWDQELAVAVALKVIRPEATAEPEAAADLHRRFKRELLLARQVTHKNVVRIHDMGEVGGVKYITMPYIAGDDLAAILRREGKLTVPRALGIARQVAAGLAAAHEAGVVHRDLKPPNIMIDPDGNALIMDFGIARSVDTGGSTVAGMVVGTLVVHGARAGPGRRGRSARRHLCLRADSDRHAGRTPDRRGPNRVRWPSSWSACSTRRRRFAAWTRRFPRPSGRSSPAAWSPIERIGIKRWPS